ncbi:MAG TPA: aspartate kinase [Candidatus Thermoplasmatota archaeon]|nr:aspartate kinase [Candidatus Thermoplasmatota archaeon]
MKFGGTSVGSGEMLVRVSDIVAASPGGRVVVISAMSGVTDAILAALDKVRRDESAIDPFLASLRDRHLKAIEDAGVSDVEADRARREIDELVQKLERLLYGIAYTEELTGKSRDLAVSFGERLAVRALAATLRSRGTPAEALDADAAGVVTDGVFGNASPIMPEVERNLARTVTPLVERGVAPVVTGFFGADPLGHVTTFGRGGSDYTASIVAAALRAERLEVWKDVDGFLTADPRVIKEAAPIDVMTYDEAAELAYVGAKVLHPRTVEPVKERGIPIYVRATFDPAGEGTLITSDTPATALSLRSCATKGKLAIIRLYGPGMAYTPGIGKKVFAALGDAKVNVYNMAASQASFALLVNEEDLDRGVKALEAMHEGIIQSVEGIRDMTLVCVVGRGIGSTHGTAGRVFTAVGNAGVNIEMIGVGASDIALNFVIRSRDAERCLVAIHDTFLKKEPRRKGASKP